MNCFIKQPEDGSGKILNLLLKLEDRMNRQLSRKITDNENPMELANDLVHHGLISEVSECFNTCHSRFYRCGELLTVSLYLYSGWSSKSCYKNRGKFKSACVMRNAIMKKNVVDFLGEREISFRINVANPKHNVADSLFLPDFGIIKKLLMWDVD